MKRKNFILPLMSAFILTFASCSQNFITNNGEAWATTYHIVYSSDQDLSDSIKAVIDLVDNELSMFNPASVLSAVNAGATDTVDVHFRKVFGCASYVSAISGGRYDPTVAPLVDIWGFGRGSSDAEPSDSLVSAVLASVGIAECRIDDTGRLTRKSDSTEFDFSSLAKGYGVDCVAAMLERNGVADYMIEIGGEIRVLGHSPKGRKWRIQIDEPLPGAAHARFTVIELGPDPVAVATSGNYRNYRVDSDGKIFGHTISPLTGRPVLTEVLSATVLASSCMLADALATACMTGTAQQAVSLLEGAGADGLIITADKDGTMTAKKIGCLPTTENP